jgi:hypothetical protein
MQSRNRGFCDSRSSDVSVAGVRHLWRDRPIIDVTSDQRDPNRNLPVALLSLPASPLDQPDRGLLRPL